mmetsp:Transcript_10252/g.26285  ORF Transcript_10252/g.26285 Transcript_10252/m.26285 type:complete len:209 (+) Transcript_10252:1129-1755(+)
MVRLSRRWQEVELVLLRQGIRFWAATVFGEGVVCVLPVHEDAGKDSQQPQGRLHEGMDFVGRLSEPEPFHQQGGLDKSHAARRGGGRGRRRGRGRDREVFSPQVSYGDWGERTQIQQVQAHSQVSALWPLSHLPQPQVEAVVFDCEGSAARHGERATASLEGKEGRQEECQAKTQAMWEVLQLRKPPEEAEMPESHLFVDCRKIIYSF